MESITLIQNYICGMTTSVINALVVGKVEVMRVNVIVVVVGWRRKDTLWQLVIGEQNKNHPYKKQFVGKDKNESISGL